MLNKEGSLNKSYLQIALEYHENGNYAFSKRLVTSKLIRLLEDIGLSIKLSFILVWFFGIILSGILLAKLSSLYDKNYQNILLNLIVYFLGASIFMAFFIPVYSYDEPLQYCLLFGSFIALYKRNYFAFILFFSFSAIVRENSLILLPGIFIILKSKHFELSWQKVTSILSFPVLFYLAYSYSLDNLISLPSAEGNDLLARTKNFNFNFQNTSFTIQTIMSMLVVLGPFLYLSWFKRKDQSGIEKAYFQAFSITLLINTTLVLTTAYARELRLFALPLIFIWPYFSQIFNLKTSFHQLKGRISNLKIILFMISLFALTFSYLKLNQIFVDYIHTPLDEYFFIMIGLICMHYLLFFYPKVNQSEKGKI
jgi:hypothetical protein